MIQKRIWLVKNPKSVQVDSLSDNYDPFTGSAFPSEPINTPMIARITETGYQQQQATFGRRYDDAKTIRVAGKQDADYITLDDPVANPNAQQYSASMKRQHRDCTAFYIHGVKEATQ